MRRILITNDDGIASDGLLRLARAASALGEVWIVAPESQRSAASHSITLHATIDVFPHDFPAPGVHAFSCSGTPADCVRVGCLNIVPGGPDVVLSGINYGYNAASDIQYSATAGAAFEAMIQGVTGIALSEGASPCHEVTDACLPGVLARWIDAKPAPGRILNVNFPSCPLSRCRGVLEDRTVSARAFYYDRYLELEALPGGGRRLKVDGLYNEEGEEGTDLKAVVDGYVSVGYVRNIG